MEVLEHNGHRIEIHQDFDPQSPREYDTFGTFQIYHRRYASPDPIVREPPHINKDEIGLKIWGYDHGGVIYKAGEKNPFHCPWDSGFAGIIFVSRAKAREWFGVKRLTKKVVERANRLLDAEVEAWNSYINGEIWGYKVFDPRGEEIDSGWGFYDKDDMIEEAKACTT